MLECLQMMEADHIVMTRSNIARWLIRLMVT